MTDHLDLVLAAMRDRQSDAPLDQLEPKVWERIEAERSQAQFGAWPWRAGLAAAMLALGAFAGGGAVAEGGADISPFAVNSTYTPSTLLEGDP